MHIRYIARIEDPQLYSPLIVQAMAARLAVELCIPITESAKLQQNLASIFQGKLTEAMTSDGLQGRSEVRKSRILLGAR